VSNELEPDSAIGHHKTALDPASGEQLATLMARDLRG
jgi:hypothetical protein